jgi:hypothetical protein
LLAAAPGRAQWWNLLSGERLPFASAAASALKRASYGCALPTTNHTEPFIWRGGRRHGVLDAYAITTNNAR